MSTEETKTWGIVELMGHKVVAGLISKSEMLGKPLLRVDVPATEGYSEFTQLAVAAARTTHAAGGCSVRGRG